MTTPRRLGPHDEPQQPGTIVAINHGDYRQQQIFVASGANIGIWYCLGGEFGPIKVVDDQRNNLERLAGGPWRQPPGTIPRHPHWEDLLTLGPATLLTPGDGAAYTAGWRAGRRDLWSAAESLIDDDPPTLEDTYRPVDSDEFGYPVPQELADRLEAAQSALDRAVEAIRDYIAEHDAQETELVAELDAQLP